MTGVEIGRAQLRMALEVEAAGLHEAERLGDAIGEFRIAARLRAVLDEAEHPVVYALQVGITAVGEGAQQVERRGRLAIGLDLPARIGRTRVRRERDVVDDVAAIARELQIAALLGRGRARLGELAGDAADLHHRRGRRERHHHRHLQKHAEEVADVVGAMLGEALGAVAALQQESLPCRDARQGFLQGARLACKHQRRKGRELLFDVGERLRVRIVRHLHDRLAAPTVGRPALLHDAILLVVRPKQMLRICLESRPTKINILVG